MKRGYDFDDLLLIPIPSYVNSREDTDISVTLCNKLELEVPIIGSPMKGIMSVDLALKLGELGAIGILPRFYNSEKERYSDYKTMEESNYNWGLSVRLDEDYAPPLGFNPDIICVDIANGYIIKLLEYTRLIKSYIIKHNLNTLLMVGNVATRDGALRLYNEGADLIRVGIGGGQLCTTRNVTGVGVPQLTAISDCKFGNSLYDDPLDITVIADGGIRNSGDMVKALCRGADAVMIGTMFSRAIESAHNGIISGSASKAIQDEYYHSTKSIEGISKEAVKDTTTEEILSNMSWGLRSAMTYLNAYDLVEMRAHTSWIEAGTGSIKKGI